MCQFTRLHTLLPLYPKIDYIKKVGEILTKNITNNSTFFIMRKLEKQMNFAISNKGNWAGSNTTVTYNENTNCSSVLLHGHNIATFDHNTNALKISSCGYETVTTKSRLNAILEEVKYGAKVFQKNFVWFVNYNNQNLMFWDGMILLDTQSLEVA